MDVILVKDVNKIGRAGERVRVKDGYGRNYLLPGRLAIEATPGNLRAFERKQAAVKGREARLRQDADKLSRRLASLSITVPKKAGADDKLFGTLTSADISQALENEKITVDRHDIEIAEPIKKLGVYTVNVRLHEGVTGRLKVWVVKE